MPVILGKRRAAKIFAIPINCNVESLRTGDYVDFKIDPEVWDLLNEGDGYIDDIWIANQGRSVISLRFVGLLDERPGVEFIVSEVQWTH